GDLVIALRRGAAVVGVPAEAGGDDGKKPHHGGDRARLPQAPLSLRALAPNRGLDEDTVAALDILAAPREQILGLGERAAARQEEVVGAAAPLPFRRRLVDPLARAQKVAILGHEIPEARPAGDEHIVRETNLPRARLFAAHEQALLDQA